MRRVICSVIFTIIAGSPLYAGTFFSAFPLNAVDDPSVTQTIIFSENTNSDIFAGLEDLSVLRHAEVRQALFVYLTSGRVYAQRALDRAKSNIDLVTPVFEEQKSFPAMIAYLPLLESGYSPTAVSRMKAVGVWQIISPTALSLGLSINPFIDERRNVEKSTRAARAHLTNLYRTFGSWDLALAAYNCGSSRVRKAMRRSKTDDYWVLASNGSLRRETAEYLPRYAALSLIAMYNTLFNMEANKNRGDSPDTYILDFPVRIPDIADLLRVDESEIRQLNPECIGILTPPGKPYEIKVPAGSAEILSANADSLYRIRFSKLTHHTVKKGESVSKIAKLYGVQPQAIILINDIKKPYLLKLGRTLYIPRS